VWRKGDRIGCRGRAGEGANAPRRRWNWGRSGGGGGCWTVRGSGDVLGFFIYICIRGVGLLAGWATLVPKAGLPSGRLISGRASGQPDVPG
jgi:hypothetical protein